MHHTSVLKPFNNEVSAYNSVPTGDGPSQGLGSSNSMQHIGSSKTQSLIEQGAVAAVVPASVQNNNTTGSRSNSQHAPQFLPNISGSTNSNNNYSQALYAATSPYQQMEEQNIPLQPLSSNNQYSNNVSSANDYFNLKQSQSVKVGPSSSTVIRSSSIPHGATAGVGKINPNNVSQPQLLNNNSNFGVHQQNSAAAPGNQHDSVQSQMQNLLSKGLRSSSEPPQPKL